MAIGKVNQLNTCSTCRISDICLPFGLSPAELQELDSTVYKNRVYRKNEILFKENAPFGTLYVLRSGSVKTYRMSGHFAGRMTGFFIQGEILGLDAIYSERHQDTAVALDVVSMCEIQFANLLASAAKMPNLQKQIMRLMSEKIISNTVEGERDTHAEKRVAVFLLNLSTRLKRAGLSGTEFILPISKKDISDYLGIAFETMSRTLSKFNDIGIINLNKKQVTLIDLRRLQEIACGK